MRRRFVLGDSHGGLKAFLQVLERSGFDNNKDQLICLGDVADGWPEVAGLFEELLKIKNLVYILGNHDKWFLEWAVGGHPGRVWTKQGGKATIQSYGGDPTSIPPEVVRLLKQAHLYYEDGLGNLFVHGGYDWHEPIDGQEANVFMWDRDMIKTAYLMEAGKLPKPKSGKLGTYKNIFVGHTTTSWFDQFTPLFAMNVIGLDTGAGWEGKLTLMDVDSKEYWQSDPVSMLYPGVQGRR